MRGSGSVQPERMDEVTVRLLGGDLRIRWDKERRTVFMTGPATVVFDGEIDLADFAS